MRYFDTLHPVTAAFYFASVLLTSVFSSSPALQLSSLAGGIAFTAVLGRGKSRRWGETVFDIVLFALIVITNPLFVHKGATHLFRLNGRPVTLEATLYGVGVAVMLLSAVLWFRCFNEIMTSDKLLCLFGRATPKISLLLSLSLRSVPLFKKRARMIRDAQKTMGLYAADGWLCRLRASMRTYSALVTQSIEGAIDMGTSMKSRGYGLKGRTSFALFRFMKRDCILCSVIACADGITIAAGACGRLDFSFYPHITAARWDALTTAAAAAFFILSFLPFVFEVKEDIKWRFCRSKI